MELYTLHYITLRGHIIQLLGVYTLHGHIFSLTWGVSTLASHANSSVEGGLVLIAQYYAVFPHVSGKKVMGITQHCRLKYSPLLQNQHLKAFMNEVVDSDS